MSGHVCSIFFFQKLFSIYFFPIKIIFTAAVVQQITNLLLNPPLIIQKQNYLYHAQWGIIWKRVKLFQFMKAIKFFEKPTHFFHYEPTVSFFSTSVHVWLDDDRRAVNFFTFYFQPRKVNYVDFFWFHKQQQFLSECAKCSKKRVISPVIIFSSNSREFCDLEFFLQMFLLHERF